MDETIACVITAKKTDASKITYRTSLDSECERIYRESYKLFALNGDVTGKAKKQQAEQIKKLENALNNVESENASFKTRIDVMQKRVKKQETKVSEISDNLAGLEEALTELQKKHPEITQEDLEAIRQPLTNAINQLNGKVELILDYLKLKKT